MSESEKLKALYELNLSQNDYLQLLLNKIQALEMLLEKHNPKIFDEYQFKVYDLSLQTLPELARSLEKDCLQQKKAKDH